MNTHPALTATATRYLSRPEGRVAYDVEGGGPLVILVPGMGELRHTYRFIAPVLRQNSFRVACVDLRGHGDSDASFSSYGDADTAGDVAALIDQLGGPAVIVGSSMAAGAAVIVAAEHPDLVSGLVLVGPFVRNPEVSAIQKAEFRILMARPWAAAMWKAYMPKLYAGQRPADFDDYRQKVVASLHRPGYTKAFSLTTRTSHDSAEARLGDVSAPAMVVMGEHDPDFPDPAAEAAWIAQRLHATVTMVPDAGHYPHSQQPDVTVAAVLRFLESVADRA